MALLSGRGIGTGPGITRRDQPWMCLVDRVEVTGVTGSAAVSAALDVAPDDPYFFDHPLDHLPGMVLVSGVLEMFRSSGAGDPEDPGQRLTVSMRFPSFCEPGPVRLEAVQLPAGESSGPAGGTRFTIRARRGEQVVVEGSVGFGTADPPPAATVDAAYPPALLLPAAPGLVHRRRPENVMISGVVAGDRTRTVAVRRPPVGHRLAVTPGGPMRAEVLVDAARQFGTLLNHTEYGRPADVTFVLLGLEAELPGGLGGEVYLRWKHQPERRGRDRILFQVAADGPDGAPRGRIGVDYYPATPTVYRRLRGRGRPG